MKTNVTQVSESRNKREGKFLIARQYKLGNYGNKQRFRDYAKFKTNCNCGETHEH